MNCVLPDTSFTLYSGDTVYTFPKKEVPFLDAPLPSPFCPGPRRPPCVEVENILFFYQSSAIRIVRN